MRDLLHEPEDENNSREAVESYNSLCEFLKQAASEGIRAFPEVKARVDEFTARFCDYRVDYRPGFPNRYAANDGSWSIVLSHAGEHPQFYLFVEQPQEWKEASAAAVQGMREEYYGVLRLQNPGRIMKEELFRSESVEFLLSDNTFFLIAEKDAYGVVLPKGTRLRKEAGYWPGSQLRLSIPATGIHLYIPTSLIPKEGYPTDKIIVGK